MSNTPVTDAKETEVPASVPTSFNFEAVASNTSPLAPLDPPKPTKVLTQTQKKNLKRKEKKKEAKSEAKPQPPAKTETQAPRPYKPTNETVVPLGKKVNPELERAKSDIQNAALQVPPLQPKVEKPPDAKVEQRKAARRDAAGRPQQPPGPPPVPSPGPAREVPPSTLSDYFRNLAYKIPQSDQTLKKYCFERGIRYDLVEKSQHDHSLTAANRWQAVKTFCEIIGRKRQSVTVLSWFGANRDLAFSPKGIKNLSMKWIIGPAIAIAGDGPREFDRQVIDDEFDEVLVCDVYQSGYSADTPLTPEVVQKLCEGSRSKCAYLIMRKFVGEVGGDVFQVNGRPYVEGTWYKTEEGMVVFQSDENSIQYSPHPTADWLFSGRSVNGVDISIINSFGPYHLLKVTKTDQLAVPIKNSPPPVPTVEKMMVRGDYSKVTEMSFRFLPRFVLNYFYPSTTEELVHRPIMAMFKTRYQMKAVTGLGFDAIHDLIQNKMQQDPLLAVVQQRYPDIYSQILRGTLLAVYFDDRTAAVENLYEHRAMHGRSEAILNNVRKADFEQTRSLKPLVFKLVAALGLAALAIYKKMKPSTASGLDFIFSRLGTPQTMMNVIVAPICEELIKMGIPYSSLLIAGLDILPIITSFYQLIQQPGIENKGELCVLLVLMFLKQLGIHQFFCYLRERFGLVWAIFAHSLWNLLCQFGELNSYLAPIQFCLMVFLIPRKASAPTAMWETFKQSYKRYDPLDAPPFVEKLPENQVQQYSLEPVQSKQWPTDVDRGSCSVALSGTPTSLAIVKEVLVEEPIDDHRLYPVVMSTAVLYTPAKTLNNTMASLMFRIHKDPYNGLPDKNFRLECWKEIERMDRWHSLLDEWRAAILRNPLSIKEACEEMGKRGKRIWSSHEQMIDGCVLRPTKSYAVKWDETIPLKFIDGVWDLKPRAICKLDPSYHAESAVWSRLLATSLHEACDGTKTFKGVAYCFASGYTQLELTQMYNNMLQVNDFCAVAGDDSICKLTYKDQSYYIEADFSMCDQSQDDCPLGDFLRNWMIKLLGQQLPIQSYQHSFSGSYKIRDKRTDFVASGEAGWQLCTGSTATTVVNSINNMAMWTYIADAYEPIDASSIEAMAKDLGFTLKVRVEISPVGLTFLKGWFLPILKHTIGDVLWVPLPSAIVKIGKLMKNPLRHFKSYQEICYMIARSYEFVPTNTPILGRYFAMFARLAGSVRTTSESEVIENFEYKTKGVVINALVDRVRVLEMMEDRYGVTVEEVVQVEKLFDSINTVPVLYHHPAIFKIRDVDYR